MSGAAQIAPGFGHACALLSKGTVSGVTCAAQGVCRLTPVVVQDLSGAVQIAAGISGSTLFESAAGMPQARF